MLELSEKKIDPGCLEIKVSGELDLAVASQLKAALEEATDVEFVVLSMEECEFMDSTAIAVIVHEHQARTKAGRRLAVAGCNSQVQRVLEVTGLTENGLVFESVDAARAA